MSPRRRIEPGTEDWTTAAVEVPSKRNWRKEVFRHARGLPGLGALTSLLVVAAIAVTGLMLRSHVSDGREAARSAEVLGYVGQFMTEFTTLDPFNANDYADGILADATGEFEKRFKEGQNAILIRVARSEPTKGTVLEAGIEKWYDDGSVSVLVATKIDTTAGPEGKPVESGNRWVVTAVKEGQQWKISQLTPVI